MTLKHTREKAAERAREIDFERHRVLGELLHARHEVARLENKARKLGMEHLEAVHTVFRIEDFAPTLPTEELPEKDQYQTAIFEAFRHLEVNPFSIPHFYQVRAVIFWWVCREFVKVNQKALFACWQEIVGEQETSQSTPIRAIIRQVKYPTNDVVKEYKEKITERVLSGSHQEHQESKEPCQLRS